MEIEVKIDAASIEKQVTEAIIATSFGTQLKAAIDDGLKRLGNSYSYDNQLKKWVEEKMREIVFDHVKKQYTAQIEDSVRAWLTSEKLETITNQVISTVVSQLTTRSSY